MAYTPNMNLQGEEEENKGQIGAFAPSAPTVAGPSVGSTPTFGGTVAGQAAPAPGNTQQRGTGYTDIDRILGANTGAGADLEKSAAQVRGKEQANFNKATNKFNEGVKTGSAGLAGFDVNGIINNVLAKPAATPLAQAGESNAFEVSAANQTAQDKANAEAAAKQAQGIASATKLLASDYRGPTSLGYGIGQTEQAKQLGALGNAQSAGVQLAENKGPLAQYNPQLSAIDQAIYGNATGSLKNINKATESQQREQNRTKNLAEKSAKHIADRNQEQKAALRAGLGQGAQGILATAGNAAERQNAGQDVAMRQAAIEGKTWNPGSGQAQSNQFLSGLDVGGLQAIGKLLGDPNLSGMQAGPAFQGGTATAAPNTAPPTPGKDPYAGLTADEATQVKKYEALGYNHDQAIQAVKKFE